MNYFRDVFVAFLSIFFLQGDSNQIPFDKDKEVIQSVTPIDGSLNKEEDTDPDPEVGDLIGG